MGVIAALLAACSAGTGPPDTSGHTTSPEPAPVHTAVPTVLILDASGSMTTPDAPGPRIDAAKNAAKALVADMPDDAHLALVTYGTKTDSSPQAQAAGCQDVTTLLPLGPLDRQGHNTAIDSLTPSGYTPISLALEQATAQLPTDGAKQAIVLVSDGEDTCGRPPCDVAAQLHTQHPGLAISTIGFRTDGPASDQLNCIANTTGGMFVQAANAKQLAARLIATQDVQAAKASLSSTGFNGIDLGTSAADIRKANNDFPDVASSGRVVVTWRDCDYTFIDGVLDTIAPHDGGRTIDGITSGSKVSEAIEFYGQPLGPVEQDAGKDWLTFLADKDKNFAYRMAIDGYNSTGTNTTGTITRITLCHCAPAPQPFADASTADVSVAGSDRMAHLASVRLARNDGFDRLVLEFTDLVPGYTIGYRPLPAQEDASGKEIPLPGANAALRVVLNPATGDGWDNGTRTYSGPSTVTAGTPVVTQTTAAGDFEAVLTWVVGLRSKVPFRVLKFDGPPRLAIDFQADAPAAQPTAAPPVATFDGYGPVKIGMTKDEILAIPGWTEGHLNVDAYSTCALNTAEGGRALFGGPTSFGQPQSDRIGTILTPKGTVTDHGVGVGSTPEEIRAAYAGSQFTIDDNADGTPMKRGLRVRDSSSRQILFYNIEADHVGAVDVGADRGESGCMEGAPLK